MIASDFRRRGHPLLFLGVLLLGWAGLRIALWQPPFAAGEAPDTFEQRAVAPVAERGRSPAGQGRASPAAASGGMAEEPPVDGAGGPWRAPNTPLPGLIPAPIAPTAPALHDAPGADRAPLGYRGAAAVPHGAGSVTRMAVGHALLAMMGLSQMQVPPLLAALIDLRRMSAGGDRPARLAQGTDAAAEPVAPARLAATGAAPPRWSADGWLLLREGDLRAPVAGQPSYGRSQAGAVLRYRLAPSSGHAPQAYVRASTALRSPRDAEVAGGLSARPLAGVPLRLAAEVRVADTQAGTDVRPAAYAVTEFPPLDLPLGARAEFYAQGGYVGGDFATAFVDGQARVTREVARIGDTALSAGAGAWGGAQKGAARVDIGPTASVSFSLGEVYSRVSVDYRLRVAGDAEPASGPALTLAAGF